jgi:hypothetical protein
MVRATTLADVFGAGSDASIGGAMALGANGARAAGPLGASLLYLALGGYRPVFWSLAGALVAVAAREVREPAGAPGA